MAQLGPRPSSQDKEDLFAPVEQRSGNRRQRHKIEDEREEKGGKREEERIFVLEVQRIAPL